MSVPLNVPHLFLKGTLSSTNVFRAGVYTFLASKARLILKPCRLHSPKT